jgi:hypothetical protein
LIWHGPHRKEKNLTSTHAVKWFHKPKKFVDCPYKITGKIIVNMHVYNFTYLESRWEGKIFWNEA